MTSSSSMYREDPEAGAGAGLRLAEDVALPALFEVDAGQLEAVEGGGDGGQALPGGGWPRASR